MAGNTISLLVLGAPLLVFGVGAWLRDVPGEWSQGALLAYGAIVITFLCGQANQMSNSVSWLLVGLPLAFSALLLGGASGLLLLGALFVGGIALSFSGFAPNIPWIICALGALLSIAAGVRMLW